MRVTELKLVGILLTLMLCVSPARADFDSGVQAYNAGNYAAAIQEFKVLAEQGLAIAQSYVGVMYTLGQGVEKDQVTAAQWFEKAARQGSGPAALTLGSMAYHGEGVERNAVNAYAWFMVAAAIGMDEATDYIARMTFDMDQDDIQSAQAIAEEIYGKLNQPAFDSE